MFGSPLLRIALRITTTATPDVRRNGTPSQLRLPHCGPRPGEPPLSKGLAIADARRAEIIGTDIQADETKPKGRPIKEPLHDLMIPGRRSTRTTRRPSQALKTQYENRAFPRLCSPTCGRASAPTTASTTRSLSRAHAQTHHREHPQR